MSGFKIGVLAFGIGMVAFVAPSLAAMEGQPFIVVELFTSEGCSSCPSAERFLTQLTQASRREQRNIFTLEFHVDYWNGLGWKDPFSSSAFTARQREYARAFGSSNVHTPQMILNGDQEYVGRDERLFWQTMQGALVVPAAAIDLKAMAKTDSALTLRYSLSSVPVGSVLNVALVQNYAASKVSRGENSGRFLEHSNVVRALEILPLKDTFGTLTLAKPQGEWKDFAVIAYLADTATMRVQAGAMLSLE